MTTTNTANHINILQQMPDEDAQNLTIALITEAINVDLSEEQQKILTDFKNKSHDEQINVYQTICAMQFIAAQVKQDTSADLINQLVDAALCNNTVKDIRKAVLKLLGMYKEPDEE